MSQNMPGITKYRVPSPVDSSSVLLVFTAFAFTLASAGCLPPITKSGSFPILTIILSSTLLTFSSVRPFSTLLLRTYDVERYYLGLCFDHDNGPC